MLLRGRWQRECPNLLIRVLKREREKREERRGANCEITPLDVIGKACQADESSYRQGVVCRLREVFRSASKRGRRRLVATTPQRRVD